jgi:hypothetical protein
VTTRIRMARMKHQTSRFRLSRPNPTYFQGFICRSVAVNEGAEGQREKASFYEVHCDLACCSVLVVAFCMRRSNYETPLEFSVIVLIVSW